VGEILPQVSRTAGAQAPNTKSNSPLRLPQSAELPRVPLISTCGALARPRGVGGCGVEAVGCLGIVAILATIPATPHRPQGQARRDRVMNAARTDNTVHRMAQMIAASNLPLAHATAIRAMLAETFSADQITAHLAEAINRARTHRTIAGGVPPT
jgi:hypothetical protein